MLQRLNWASAVFAALAAVAWLTSALLPIPEKMFIPFGGPPGPLQDLADALKLQAEWSAAGAGCACVAAIFQAWALVLTAREQPRSRCSLLDRARAAASQDDRIPADMAQRIANGESALKVLREWRGLSLADLALAAGADAEQLARAEAGEAKLDAATAIRLAPHLRLQPETLLI